ncbi:hypothetical protein FKM82_027218 [Ascaphus truei]
MSFSDSSATFLLNEQQVEYRKKKREGEVTYNRTGKSAAESRILMVVRK